MFDKWAAKLNQKRKEEEEEIVFRPHREPADELAPAVPKSAEPETPAPAAPTAPIKSADNDSSIELKVVRPSSFEEASVVADHLLAGRTVALNVELLDKAQVLRMLDFLSGITYATDGEIKRVAQYAFLVTSHNVDVSDDEA